jgi:hypothetical protein
MKSQLMLLWTLLLAACLNAPRPVIAPSDGSVATLRGSETLALFGEAQDLEIIQAELQRHRSKVRFVSADHAQVIVQFQFMGTDICIDCGEGFDSGPLQPVRAFATIERLNEQDHCLPKLLRAEWNHEAYRRRSLALRFARDLAALL